MDATFWVLLVIGGVILAARMMYLARHPAAMAKAKQKAAAHKVERNAKRVARKAKHHYGRNVAGVIAAGLVIGAVEGAVEIGGLADDIDLKDKGLKR